LGVKSSTSVALRGAWPDDPPQPATIAAAAIDVTRVAIGRRMIGAA
jgi:hypothetical protein